MSNYSGKNLIIAYVYYFIIIFIITVIFKGWIKCDLTRVFCDKNYLLWPQTWPFAAGVIIPKGREIV